MRATRRGKRLRTVTHVAASLALGRWAAGCSHDLSALPRRGDAGAHVIDVGADASVDAPVDAPARGVRPLAPVSTATVTSRRPVFRWVNAPGSDGARVDVCADRACAGGPVETIDATGSSAQPTRDLRAGVLFWRVSPHGGGAPSPWWELVVGARTAPTSTSFGTMLDLNGDGRPDVAVGAPGSDEVRVYLGGADQVASVASVVLRPASALRGYYGGSVSSAGDVNGDGYADLVVGAYNANASAGAAFVYLGRAGFGDGPGDREAPIVLVGAGVAGDLFGKSVANAGDVDGDGYGDVVVGADGTRRDQGAVYVFRGGPEGVSPTDSVALGGVGSGLGISVASAGDVDGDGFGDVIAGADVTLRGPAGAAGMNYGYAVSSAGDVNGDGCADVIVGAWLAAGGGGAFVYLGGTTRITAGQGPSPALPPPSGALRHGRSVAGVGDVDGDGYGDVLVGADNTNVMAGRAYLYRGGAAGLSAAVATTLDGTAGSQLGRAVAGVGDVNRDGRGDVLVGADNGDRALLFFGAAGGLSTTPATTLTGAAGTDFGTSVAALWRRAFRHGTGS
jgi:FG-GAP-like repeat/FG-GAP repeat